MDKLEPSINEAFPWPVFYSRVARIALDSLTTEDRFKVTQTVNAFAKDSARLNREWHDALKVQSLELRIVIDEKLRAFIQINKDRTLLVQDILNKETLHLLGSLSDGEAPTK